MAAQHPRTLIRKAIAAQLRFKTAAQDRVHPQKTVPWKTAELPGIAIYSNTETSEVASVDGDLERAPIFEVVGVVAYSEEVDDTLDDLDREIERAVGADFTFGGAARESTLTETTHELWDEGGRLLGATRLTYAVKYDTGAVPE